MSGLQILTNVYWWTFESPLGPGEGVLNNHYIPDIISAKKKIMKKFFFYTKKNAIFLKKLMNLKNFGAKPGLSGSQTYVRCQSSVFELQSCSRAHSKGNWS